MNFEQLQMYLFDCFMATRVVAFYCAKYSLIAMLPIICLNGILVSLFLLKRLFFKPNFVESRYKTIAIDSSSQTDLEVAQVEACSNTNCDTTGTPNGLNSNEASSVQSLISTKIRQLYRNDLANSLEFVLPSNAPIKLGEKIGSGFIGVLFKAELLDCATESKSQPALCAKLIDMMRLRKNIEEVNKLAADTLTSKIHLNNLFTGKTCNSEMVAKYLAYYHQFLDCVWRLEAKPVKPTTSASTNRLQHKNILYYEKILIHEGKCIDSRANCKRTFRNMHHANRQQFPTLVMLVMPYAKMNLRQALINEWQHFTEDTATEWGRQVGEGLAFLHQTLHMLHCNLKPEQILVFENMDSNDGRVESNKRLPLHLRYHIKISDCGTALLLPTASKVLSQSNSSGVWILSPPLMDKFGANKLVDIEYYDVYCYSMVLLLMLLGAEDFARSFIWPAFPTGLLSNARYRLIEQIEIHPRVPELFVDLFRQVFASNNLPPVTVAQMLKHEALKQ